MITKKLSDKLSVRIIDNGERIYCDEHNNELLYAKPSEARDGQWFVTLPRDVFEVAPAAGGITAQFYGCIEAVELIALAMRAEMIAAGY